MTKEEKVNLVKGMDIERLLKQYETSVNHYKNIDEYCRIFGSDRYDGIMEDYEIVRTEVIRRLTINERGE